MERVQKEQASCDAASASYVAQGKSVGLPAQTDMVACIHSSPLMIAQRKQLQGMFGDRAQLQTEEEEPLQGVLMSAQRVAMPEDEDPPLQGKFSSVQRLEEEEPLQGRFAPESTVQREPEPVKPNNTGLPDDLKTGVESLSGMSLDHVNVHYNSSQPAQLNALAYAQGSDIHVAPGQEKHLPHETWHVVQQAQGRVQPTRQMKNGVPVNDDVGLEHEADVMGEKALQTKEFQAVSSENVRSVGLTPLAPTPLAPASGAHVAAAPASTLRQYQGEALDASTLPGFNQGEYGSCGAASIVTALVVWDRENKDPTSPNNLVVTACDIALVYMDDHKQTLIKNLEERFPGEGTEKYDIFFAVTQQARDYARVPGAKLTQKQFEEIGAAFYGIYIGGGTGLPRAAREALVDMLGIKTGQANDIASFDDIFASPILAKLEPGRIAQVAWYVIKGPSTNRLGETPLGSHAFLIGRFKDSGTWFLSDQGAVPALELKAPDLMTLKQKIRDTKRYWTGPPPYRHVFGNPDPTPVDNSQVLLLGESGGVTNKAKTLVLTPGQFLAEVDDGILTTGSRIIAGDFVMRTYSEPDGMKALMAIPVGKGGVMVENPIGLFHVHETSTVSDANLNVTEIDKGDSVGGRLNPASPHYYSAWLRLCSITACSSKPLKVY